MTHADDLLLAAKIVSASAAGLPKSLGGDNEALASRLREAAAKPDLLPGLREAADILGQRADWRSACERIHAAITHYEQSKEQT